MTNLKYHDKKYTKKTTFTHSEEHELKLEKESRKRGVNKSELIRQLIDTM